MVTIFWSYIEFRLQTAHKNGSLDENFSLVREKYTYNTNSTFSVNCFHIGIVSLMYGVLLHSDAPSRGDNNQPPDLPTSTTLILTTGFKLLNHLATLDLQLLQVYILIV